MKVTPLKTKIVQKDDNFFDIIDDVLPALHERNILTVSSKIIALCEGNVYPTDKFSKVELVEMEADYYLDKTQPFTLTIKNQTLIPSAGVDESNCDGMYVAWPKDPFDTAKKIREYICQKISINDFGVIITDSAPMPMRRGTEGIAIAFAGFSPLKDYINKPDLFGRKLTVTKSNYADALAAAAVLVMGEGNEQTPMASIEDLPFIQFHSENPNPGDLLIDQDNDIYGGVLKGANWKKGKRRL